jgi:tetrapyrrole methylase family protein/MazG family protein
VYTAIVDRLVASATTHGAVLYAVPGSPLVAERTVELLRARTDVVVNIHAALSFLDLAWAALGIDPLSNGVRIVDGQRFAVTAAGERGPLLVAQCDSPSVLSDIKLAIDDTNSSANSSANDAPPTVTVLWHLGLPEQRVIEMSWNELDRFTDADHLTSLWIADLATPVGQELIRFHELVRTLRQQCPWDREQTHHSLTRHLLEETYETLEAIEALDTTTGEGYEHLAEELGDVLFQVFFHSVLAAEAGQFTVADVARGVHDKLVNRHPHVFPPTGGPGSVVVGADGSIQADTAAQVLTNWEQIKQAEKGRASVMEGIPGNLPALAHATKVQRKAASVGFDWPDVGGALPKVHEELGELVAVLDDEAARRDELGDLLFAVCNVARHLAVDPEAALRAASAKFRTRFEAVERMASADGVDMHDASLSTLDGYWDRAKLHR